MEDLSRLLRPRSVAVVGASERPGSYGGEALLNLRRFGFDGDVYAINPRRTRVHDIRCHPSLSSLPSAPDAVVVAIPAAGAPVVIEEAGAIGCGGAVVFAAGFAEGGAGALEQELAAAARRHRMPVCGPNGNGIVSLVARAPLWGDAVLPREPGPVALVSQSGNLAVNALAARRGLRLHTVVSSGNGAVLDAADFTCALARQDGVRSIALYVEDDGDGERWCEAFEVCARAGVAVTVLKAGSSPAGAAAAEAHTGAIAGDQRAFQALAEEAGAAWARDPHELLELAKVLALGERRGRGSRLALMTCSGGDSAVAADLADDMGIELPPLSVEAEAHLTSILPSAARAANPLDYTSLLWDEPAALRALVAGLADDAAIDAVLVLFDDVMSGTEVGDSADSWAAVLDAVRVAAANSAVPVGIASTLPEFQDDEAAARLLCQGIPAIAGMATGLRAMAALGSPAPDAARIAAVGAAAARRGQRPEARGEWLAEHAAKRALADAGIAVPIGSVVRDEEAAVAAWMELGGPVAMKLSGARLRHKTDAGALALDLDSEFEVRDAFLRLTALPVAHGARVLVERMAEPGVELLIAARRDGVVPTLVLALGGIYAELTGDAAVVALPATPDRVKRALRGLRGAALLDGARGGPPVDIDAVAALAMRVGDLLLDGGFDLIELNPVVATPGGATALDALAKRSGGLASGLPPLASRRFSSPAAHTPTQEPRK